MSPLAAALLHLLWEGGLVGLAVALAQPALGRVSAGARYAWLGLALAAMPVMFAVTWALAGPEGSAVSLAGRLPVVSPYIVAAWLAGVSAMTAYSLGGWVWTLRLRRGMQLAVPDAWQQQMQALRLRLRVGARVRLGLSAAVAGPCAVGCWRPWILLPLSAVTALAPEQLEAVLAHELAHIRRHDYLVNLLQRGIEIAFFYHPVVWWLSRQLREERENCCDDIAIAACGDRTAYARTLVELAAWRSELAMAAAGGSLRQRVERIVAAAPARRWRLGAGLGFIALAVAALGVPRGATLPLPPQPLAPAVAVYVPPPVKAVPRAAARVQAARLQPTMRPSPPPAAKAMAAPFTAVAFVPACGSQVQWVPRILPDGSVWLVPRTITQCEVLVLTTT